MRKRTALAAAVLLLIAACGGNGSEGSPTTTTAPPGTSQTDPQPESTTTQPESTTTPADPSSSSVGTVTLDGETFTMTSHHRCEPFLDGPEDIELQAQGDRIQVFVYYQPDAHEFDMQGSAVGLWGGGAMEIGGTWRDMATSEVADGPLFTVSGNRITGALTVWDLDQEESKEVTFDLEIPSTIDDCAL